MRFTATPPVAEKAVGSYPTFSPLPDAGTSIAATGSRARRRAVCFLWHSLSSRRRDARGLPGIMLYGARTFLLRASTTRRSPQRLSDLPVISYGATHRTLRSRAFVSRACTRFSVACMRTRLFFYTSVSSSSSCSSSSSSSSSSSISSSSSSNRSARLPESSSRNALPSSSDSL